MDTFSNCLRKISCMLTLLTSQRLGALQTYFLTSVVFRFLILRIKKAVRVSFFSCFKEKVFICSGFFQLCCALQLYSSTSPWRNPVQPHSCNVCKRASPLTQMGIKCLVLGHPNTRQRRWSSSFSHGQSIGLNLLLWAYKTILLNL